jgi:hypothetical protein
MDCLVNFLEKYKNLKPPHESTIKSLINVIYDECGIQIKYSDVKISRGGAVISCHPAVRSEISRSSSEIINILNKKYNIRISFIR